MGNNLKNIMLFFNFSMGIFAIFNLYGIYRTNKIKKRLLKFRKDIEIKLLSEDLEPEEVKNLYELNNLIERTLKDIDDKLK